MREIIPMGVREARIKQGLTECVSCGMWVQPGYVQEAEVITKGVVKLCPGCFDDWEEARMESMMDYREDRYKDE